MLSKFTEWQECCPCSPYEVVVLLYQTFGVSCFCSMSVEVGPKTPLEWMPVGVEGDDIAVRDTSHRSVIVAHVE